MSLTKIDYHVFFVGFKEDELDTIYVHKYKAGYNFDSLMTIDTLIGSNISIANDTSNTLLSGGYTYNYKLSFAGNANEFYLKEPVYPEPMKYTAYGCGRYSVSPPNSITVNNYSKTIPQLSINWGCLFLKKY